MRSVILALGALACFFTPHAVAQVPQGAVDDVRSRVVRRIADVPGATVGVAYRDIASGRSFDIDPDTLFHAASTMKVPVLIEYFRAIDAGRLGRNQDVLLVNSFPSIADGSPFSVGAGDDSDSSLYAFVGRRIAVRALVDRMITRSSNLATNAVIALVGAARADSSAHALGAHTIRVLRGVEDGKAFQRGLNNVTSAPDLAALLLAIEQRRAASPASCDEMLDILAQQEFNDEIPAGLPRGTRVAHKTGWITGVLHDAALVYPPGGRPYVLVVLTKGIPDEKVARQLIVDISRLVWSETSGKAN